MFIPDLDKTNLLERLKFTLKKKDVIQLAESFSRIGVEPNEILFYTMNSDDTTAFHSAWVLENMLLPNPFALDYYLPEILDLMPLIKSESVKRHLSKLSAIGCT